MSFDGVVTKSIVKELKEKLLGSRVDRIFQPEEDELSLVLHSRGSNHRLLISASSNNPRIYLSNHAKKNPQTPPMFCMLLRKHLLGGIILNIEQFNMDRLIFIDISTLDELGESSEMRLAIEIMGRHSNIILINKKNNKIIDSIIRVSQGMSRIRQILPGFTYEIPPSQNKSNPLTTSKDEFYNLLENEKQKLDLFKFFYFNYIGLSPMISKEICYNSNIDINRSIGSLQNEELNTIYDTFSKFLDTVDKENFTPLYIDNDNSDKIIAFYSIDLNQYGQNNKHFLSSISEVLDIVYRKKNVSNQTSQKSQSIKKTIKIKLDRATNKLVKQKEELLSSKDRDKFKVYADIISANIHRIPKGEEEVQLENFYDENLNLINIPLNKKISAPENAQRYYKKYSKLKNAEILLLKQIPETESEISYLEHVLVSLDNANEIEELDEIREELIAEGYIRDRNKRKHKNKKKIKLSAPHHYVSQDGFHIYVGKNNRQNEYLTLQFANREDIWLHVQNMPGSHVIIKKSNNQEVPSGTLEEASTLAAYFSKGKNSSNVSVDFTERKNIKKIRGGKPGMVSYENFKTINITPSKKAINKIKKI
ncbi:MAG TPA: NFACT RNA binding domain-containing protein [Tissierellaceae bacterium]|nr:NFACT RNA binding domain-containing protein [Tissierellaceae bacterium]